MLKKKFMNFLILALLTAVLVCSFFGCGKKIDDSGSDSTVEYNVQSDENVEVISGGLDPAGDKTIGSFAESF